MVLKLVCRIAFKDPKDRVPTQVETCFAASWLDAKAENDAKGRTNREIQIEVGAQMNVNDLIITDILPDIYRACSCDTRAETIRGHLADVGWAYAPCASQPSRSNIANDPQSIDPNWRSGSFNTAIKFCLFKETDARGRVYSVEGYGACCERSARGKIQCTLGAGLC